MSSDKYSVGGVNNYFTKRCLTHVEKMRNICKYRNYKQQYEISQAAAVEFKIITNYIWRTKFKELDIRGYIENDFIVKDKIHKKETFTCIKSKLKRNKYECLDVSALHFREEEMEFFLNVNKDNIKKLKIEVMGRENDARFPLRYEFKCLTHMEFHSTNITIRRLRYLADNCKNIMCLNFSKCLHISVLAEDESLEILRTLVRLKRLEITVHNMDRCNFNIFVKIINQLTLKELVFNGLIKKAAEGYQLDTEKLKHYTVFETGPILDPADSSYFLENFLTNFENLKTFCLSFITFNQDLFTVLRQSCKNLLKLTLNFCIIEYFAALPTLKLIYFHCCRGLTNQHLQTIINDMKIECFIATSNNFAENFDTLLISPTLYSVHIENFEGTVNINTQLMNLQKLYLQDLGYVDQKIRLDFATRLRYLSINLSSINITHFLELQRLEKVVLISCYSFEMAKLQQLLQHKSLKELSILDYSYGRYLKNLREAALVRTNLRYLNIPTEMMICEKDFVLDLLNLNTELSLKCGLDFMSSFAYASFVQDLLLDLKFPNRYKSIKICGILMDCDAIRNNFTELIDLLKFFDFEYYIILD